MSRAMQGNRKRKYGKHREGAMPVTFWEDQEFKELLREQAQDARLPHWTLSSQISFMLRDYLGLWKEPYRPRIDREKIRQACRRLQRMVLVCLVVLLPAPLFAEQRINPMTGYYETVLPEAALRFNAPEREWTYAPPDARLELNRSTFRWEYPGQSRSVPYDPVPYEFRRDTDDYNATVRGLREAERAW